MFQPQNLFPFCGRFMLGRAHELLGNGDDVESCYERALQLPEHDVMPFEVLPLLL